MYDTASRWGLLHAAIYDCFNIQYYIDLADQYRKD
jgi:hypothetical protein